MIYNIKKIENFYFNEIYDIIIKNLQTTMSSQLISEISEFAQLSIPQIWRVLNHAGKPTYDKLFKGKYTVTDLTEPECQRIVDGFLKSLDSPFEELKSDYDTWTFDGQYSNKMLFYHVCIAEWKLDYIEILDSLSRIINSKPIEKYIKDCGGNSGDDICITSDEEALSRSKAFKSILLCPPGTFNAYGGAGFTTHGFYKSFDGNIYEMEIWMAADYRGCCRVYSEY